MKVLQVHNFYREAGGEDQVFAAECELLRSKGHSVWQYVFRNDMLDEMSGIEAALRTVWNQNSFRGIQRLLREYQPDVMHCHNTFPLISPAIYYAAASADVPVIQTLHNYRLLCPGSTFYRGGHICEDCLHSFVPYRAALHGCYRQSRAASACTAAMLTLHRAAGTWHSKICAYIALTEFARRKFIEGGLPAERILVKSNFLQHDPGAGMGDGGYALFIGRLAEEKGICTLLKAWEHLPHIPLKIAGTGPLSRFVQERAAALCKVEYLGQCARERIFELLHAAALLVFPSEWYEGLPTTLIEAMACGTPVVCSALGAMNEVVRNEVNGVLFEAGNAESLANVIRSLFADPARLSAMRYDARSLYKERYTPEDNYEQLVRIYENAGRGRYSVASRPNNEIAPINTR